MQKCSISLHIQVLPETWQTGMDLIDLTRILGILIDNAIEEVLLVPDGIIESALQENACGCSYTIRKFRSPAYNPAGHPCRNQHQRRVTQKRAFHCP